MKEDNLLFLISQPRSGSTLTQRILGSHSKIFTISEPWLMLHPAYSLKKDGIFAEYNYELERDAFEGFLGGLPRGRETYLKELRSLYLKLYSYYMKDTECDYFMDKTPRYHLIVDELMEIFPKAKYIFLLRNPLSVLGSIVNTWLEGNWHLLSRFKYDLTSSFYSNSYLLDCGESNNCTIIRYEELLDEPTPILGNVIKYLGLEFEEEILKYYENNHDYWRFGDQENVYKKKGIDSAHPNKWVNGLEDPQYWRVLYDYLEYIGKECFDKLGYSYKENYDILMDKNPLSNLDEIVSKTFPLSSFMDSTRDCMIDNVANQRIIRENNVKLRNNDSVIREMNDKQEESSRQMLEMERELQQTKNESINLKNLLADKKNESIRLENLLADKDKYIRNKKEELSNVVAERDKKICLKNRIISEYENKLNLITSSKRYKLGCMAVYPYLKIVEKLRRS